MIDSEGIIRAYRKQAYLAGRCRANGDRVGECNYLMRMGEMEVLAGMFGWELTRSEDGSSHVRPRERRIAVHVADLI